MNVHCGDTDCICPTSASTLMGQGDMPEQAPAVLFGMHGELVVSCMNYSFPWTGALIGHKIRGGGHQTLHGRGLSMYGTTSRTTVVSVRGHLWSCHVPCKVLVAPTHSSTESFATCCRSCPSPSTPACGNSMARCIGAQGTRGG